ncbi:MAG: hypothetical protein JXA93_08250 [Anaerolineae bacterium]|nr:hypothetical protein [Anaerolineae bacterium]
MADLPTVDAIVHDIEFELLLGIAPDGDVARALAEVRREQNRLRSEYARRRGRVGGRDVAGDLLRVNDMLLDVLQEVLSRLARVESVVERMAGRRAEGVRAAFPVADGALESGEGIAREVAGADRAIPPGAPDLWPGVTLDVKPLPLPIAGRVIDRLRLALHRVAVYYVHRLAEQQGVVNVYHAGEVEQLKHLLGEQQRRLAELEAEIGNLRAQAGTGGTDQKVGIEDG